MRYTVSSLKIDYMMRKIKVLYCMETIGFGGVEQRRLLLSRNCPAEYELKICCTQAIGDLPKLIKNEDVSIYEVGVLDSIFDIDKYKKVLNIIEEYQPDIIHGAVFEGVALAAICGRLKKVPIVVLEETSDPQNRSKKADILVKLFSLFCDRFIGVSQATTEYLARRSYVSQRKLLCIDNGVSPAHDFSENEIKIFRKSLDYDDDDVVVGTVCRLLDEHKKVSDLIKAFSVLQICNSKLKLLIVGGGFDERLLKALVCELGLSKKVYFSGYQEDANPYFSIMDVFALTSQYEAFGLVVAEAMMYGLPTIVTSVGGMKLVVDDNVTGLHCEQGNVSDIANKLGRLVESKELRRVFGKAGFEKAQIQYSEKVYTDKVFSLYADLLQEKGIVTA